MEYRAEGAAPGLYATGLRWTDRAAALIRAQEYRYISPVIAWDRQTGEVRAVLMAALTNRPALDGLTDLTPLAALAAGFTLPEPQEPDMDLHALRNALALPNDADEAAIIQAATDARTRAEQAQTDLAALTAQRAPDPAAWVPMAVHQEAIAALRTERTAGRAAEIDRLLDAGLADGRIPGQATADWLRGLGVDACREYLADAPAVVALTGATQTGGRAPAGVVPAAPMLADEELAVCTQMGLSAETYLATKGRLFPAASETRQ